MLGTHLKKFHVNNANNVHWIVTKDLYIVAWQTSNMVGENLSVREKTLEAVLEEYSKNEVLAAALVFRGGGAMHFIYSSPRYSSDLDFATDTDDYEVLKRNLGMPIKIDGIMVEPEMRTSDSGILRIKYDWGPKMPKGVVEIAPDKPLDYSPARGMFSPLLVSSPTEIYADKIAATAERMTKRGKMKGTDVFDLNYLMSNLNVRLEDAWSYVPEKLSIHGGIASMTPQLAMQIIDFMLDTDNQELFRMNIRKTMMPDVYDPARFKEEYFRRSVDHFKPFT